MILSDEFRSRINKQKPCHLFDKPPGHERMLYGVAQGAFTFGIYPRHAKIRGVEMGAGTGNYWISERRPFTRVIGFI